MRRLRHGRERLERVFQDRVRYFRPIGGGLDLDGNPTDGPIGGTAAHGKDDPNQSPTTDGTYCTDKIYVCRHKVARPRVFIPVFPGTNCEYDSARAFETCRGRCRR